MYTLDWKHAHIGRLHDDSLNPTPDLTAELGICTARLAGEMTAGKLPFLDLPFRKEMEEGIQNLLPHLQHFKHMVILGIGGSALGTRALQKAFFPQQDRFGHSGPWVWILDNVDAGELSALMTALDPTETLVVTISKSGGTIETLSQYFIIREWMIKSFPETWREHFIFVTDAHSGFLRQEAEREGIPSLSVPDNLGGRYSVISAVGMLPAAFMGLPWQTFLDGVQSVNTQLVYNPGSAEALREHPAWQLANWCSDLYLKDYSQLIFFSYIPAWACFGQWFGQLWAESLGKNGKGTMPLPAIGVTDQHSLQQMFLDGPKDKGCIQLYCSEVPQYLRYPMNIPETWSWLRGKAFSELLQAETLGAAAALAHHNVPLVRLRVPQADMYVAGEVMGLLMATTVLTGLIMDINPLDQPAVELGKRLACSRLGSTNYPEEAAILNEFLTR